MLYALDITVEISEHNSDVDVLYIVQNSGNHNVESNIKNVNNLDSIVMYVLLSTPNIY